MSNKIVTFDQFDAANLKGSEPIPKEIKKANETIKYNDIKLSYNYGSNEDPTIQDLFFEGPVMTSTGITTKVEAPTTGKDGKPYVKVSNSMMLVFDLADLETRDDSMKALEKLDEVFTASCYCIAACKGKLKMHHFDPTRPGESYKNPIYWPRDENGEKVKGKNPNIWVKLRPYGSTKTLFTDLKGNVIDWNLLKNVNVTLLPLFHFEKIYVGAKPSLQVFLASAIVLKIVAAGTESRQMSTLDRLKAKYGNSKVDEVESQLADLRMARQEALSNSVSTNNEFGDHQDGEEKSGSMHSLSGPSNASLQDFLGAAPQMNPQPSTQNTMPPLPNSQPLRLNVQNMKIN